MALVERALYRSADETRYRRRLDSNPNLAKLGKMPAKLNEIVNDKHPSFCHGLAFRMATYSDSCDALFNRWEKLLKDAGEAEGWFEEYKHWKNEDDHWAFKWDRFNHFLWLLQCFEYFSENSCRVVFPASKKEPKPDLHVVKTDGSYFFVECYFYTKWWGREHFLEDLLSAIDEDLRVKRTHNTSLAPSSNPMSADSGKPFIDLLAILEEELTPGKLDASV